MPDDAAELIGDLRVWLGGHGFEIAHEIVGDLSNQQTVFAAGDVLVQLSASRGIWTVEVGLRGLERLYGTQEWRAWAEGTELPWEPDDLGAQVTFVSSDWLAVASRATSVSLVQIEKTMRRNNAELMLRRYGRVVE